MKWLCESTVLNGSFYMANSLIGTCHINHSLFFNYLLHTINDLLKIFFTLLDTL
jgi:hypothetical protein